MQRRLIFRAEANETIGRGHISRCMAVADMLKADVEILFICLQINKNYVSTIVNDYKLLTIEHEKDLYKIITKVDLLWIDGYHFTEAWKRETRPLVNKLIETNDIPYEAKNIDILINHTPGLTKEYFRGSAKNTNLYLGLDYALLRQKFLQRAREGKSRTKGSGVFICFGGADTFDLGEKFVSTLLENKFSDPIYWVSNDADRHRATYRNKNVIILSGLNEDEMIETMSKAKVMLIPSSVLSFEAMALRKPIFTCYFVDNQKLIHEGLVKNNLAKGIGYVEKEKDVSNAVKAFLNYYDNDEIHMMQMEKQMEELDGKSDVRIKGVI